MTYSERLHIPWWWMVLGLVLAVSLSVAVLAYVHVGVGIAVSALIVLAIVLALVAYSLTSLTVDADALTAGRYRVEHAYIASATPLEGEEARLALGPDADHRAFLFTRPFLPSLVRVELADPADPHPYWLVSTRHPRRLAAAIEGTGE